MIVTIGSVDVGSIRCLVAEPAGSGRRPGVILYSDIFQLTPPMVRMVKRLAGYGFRVAAPELYGRIEPAGTVLDFDRDRQRALDDADAMQVPDLDADRRTVLDWLMPRSTAVGVGGWCFGGHLAFRAAFEPEVAATACFYGTGIHNGKLGASANAGTLERVKEIRAPLMLVWGGRDPHIPGEGRDRIHSALQAAGVAFDLHVYADGEHAFMRDEGPRHDPEATDQAFSAMVNFFRRHLSSKG
jgi:carboxymethylenebutenolidase